METNVDCQKYRKSTHIASVDVEAIIAEKGTCELTIKLAFYDKGVDVSGNKTDGYFLKFEEPVKDMVVNSGNRKKISEIVRLEKGLSAVESRNISNWVGLKIRLLVDENVKMMGQVVGGIVIDRNYRPSKAAPIDYSKQIAAINACKTLDEMKTVYTAFTKDEQKATLTAKDAMKTKLTPTE